MCCHSGELFTADHSGGYLVFSPQRLLPFSSLWPLGSILNMQVMKTGQKLIFVVVNEAKIMSRDSWALQ